jgi:hypothetical protein
MMRFDISALCNPGDVRVRPAGQEPETAGQSIELVKYLAGYGFANWQGLSGTQTIRGFRRWRCRLSGLHRVIARREDFARV